MSHHEPTQTPPHPSVDVHDIWIDSLDRKIQIANDAATQSVMKEIDSVANLCPQPSRFFDRVRSPLAAKCDFDAVVEQVLGQRQHVGRPTARDAVSDNLQNFHHAEIKGGRQRGMLRTVVERLESYDPCHKIVKTNRIRLRIRPEFWRAFFCGRSIAPTYKMVVHQTDSNGTVIIHLDRRAA